MDMNIPFTIVFGEDKYLVVATDGLRILCDHTNNSNIASREIDGLDGSLNLSGHPPMYG